MFLRSFRIAIIRRANMLNPSFGCRRNHLLLIACIVFLFLLYTVHQSRYRVTKGGGSRKKGRPSYSDSVFGRKNGPGRKRLNKIRMSKDPPIPTEGGFQEDPPAPPKAQDIKEPVDPPKKKNKPVEPVTSAPPTERTNPLEKKDDIPANKEGMPEWERKVKSNPWWIIVGTIHDPTEPIATMAAQPGWSLCIVGDYKTPEDWHMEQENIVFLSLKRQAQLGFKIHEKMPIGIYGRKNMGYMFAIKHGAKVIYDTDDDNELIVDGLAEGFILNLHQKLNASSMLVYQPFSRQQPMQRSLVNPYAHFGQPNLWPRGLPLSCLQPKYMKDLRYTRAWSGPGSSLRPMVQQGLANGDPDIDAVYRLTRKRNANKIDITFDFEAPGVTLPPGILAPFNAQNTLFHYESFWGLMLSVTTTFRVTDIWRSYWMQRILWDIGGTLSFQIPSVYQDRNEHNYFYDFVEEYRLYNNTAPLVEFLLKWTPPKGDIYARMQDLADKIYEKGFWLEGDAILMKAWIEDLKSIGYKPPAIVDRKKAFSALFGDPFEYQPRSVAGTFVSTLGARAKEGKGTAGLQPRDNVFKMQKARKASPMGQEKNAPRRRGKKGGQKRPASTRATQ